MNIYNNLKSQPHYTPDDSVVFEYSVNIDKTTCTIKGLSNDSNPRHISIPSKIKDYTVTSIAAGAFENGQMETVSIPSTIKSIGNNAFANCKSLYAVYGLEMCADIQQISDKTFFLCKSLNTIKLPPDLTYIGKQAFSNCYSLKSISFPTTIKRIDEGAFVGCLELSDVSFPDSITSFGAAAFGMCNSLREIVLPPLVQSYEMNVFGDCAALEKILVGKNNAFANSINGVLYNKSNTILWSYPSGKTEKQFIVPNGVITLGSCSFSYNDHIETLYIPNSIKNLNTNVFCESINLKSIKYDGSIVDWMAIKKDFDWNAESSNFTIYCTDGQIAKDGTVTYN